MSSDSDEFIDIESPKDQKTKLINGYQFDGNKKRFIKVGIFSEIPKQFIDKISMDPYEGIIVSNLFSHEETEMLDICKLISIGINNKTSHMGEMSYAYDKLRKTFIVLWQDKTSDLIIEEKPDFIGEEKLIEYLCAKTIDHLFQTIC